MQFKVYIESEIFDNEFKFYSEGCKRELVVSGVREFELVSDDYRLQIPSSNYIKPLTSFASPDRSYT